MKSRQAFEVVPAMAVIEGYARIGSLALYKNIYLAVATLAELPGDQGLRFKRGELSGMAASKKAHVYARTFKMEVVTRNSGEYMMICRKPKYTHGGLEASLVGQTLAAQSSRKEISPVPRKSVAVNQLGSGSCASARNFEVVHV